MGAVNNYIFAIANPVGASVIPGALCNVGIRNINTTYPFNTVPRGSHYITTTTAGDAANFHPGDLTTAGVESYQATEFNISAGTNTLGFQAHIRRGRLLPMRWPHVQAILRT